MADEHTNPSDVTSPRARLGPVTVVHDGGAGSWSVATFTWDGHPAVGIRWNGGGGGAPLGNPQSRGLPTWFIVPGELADAVLTAARAKGTPPSTPP